MRTSLFTILSLVIGTVIITGADPGPPPYFGSNLDFFKCETGAPGGGRQNLDNGALPF